MIGALILGVVLAQGDLKTGKAFRLWSGDAPYQHGTTENDIPTLTPFMPEKPSKNAVVVCPGGGYWMLADHEGHDYAEYLAKQGITAFVLRYRLGQFKYQHPAMLSDAQRAIRYVRSLGYNKVGIMGSSAGGHLAGTACTHFDFQAYEPKDDIDQQVARPDFGVLCYAVLTFDKPFGHEGSRDNLIGKDATPEQMAFMNLPGNVTKNTPPCFLWHTSEDTVVPPQNSEMFAAALRKNGVPYEYHVFQKGPYGIGLTDKAPYNNVHPWAYDLVFWLKSNKWLD